jgi:hypothetical protein
MSEPARSPGYRRQVIGALLALHLVAIGVGALPAVQGLTKAAWKGPSFQRGLDQWVAGLEGIGIDVERQELQDFLWVLANGYQDARRTLQTPFRPYYRWAGTRQTWNLFTAPDHAPSRLEIDVEEDGAWRPVFVARSDEHTWQRRTLDDVRLRKAAYWMGWPRGEQPLRRLADALAPLAARDFPGATRLRLRVMRVKTRSVAEVREGVPATERQRRKVLRELKEHR